jgi:hypothetical protein
MTDSLGNRGDWPPDRNRGFANSNPSAAECARCAIAMLIIPIQGEAGCGRRLQRNLAHKHGNPGLKI